MNNLVRALFFNTFRIIFNYFSWMIRFSSNKDKYPIELRYNKLRKLIKKVNSGLKIDITVNGLDNLPKDTKVCFFSNHLNLADPIIFIDVLNIPTTFVVKKEIKKYPFVGKCVNAIDGEFLDRQDLKKGLKSMMRVEKDMRIGDKNWLIFAEGTRNKDDHALLRDFHYGSFKAPMKAGVPIVPCAIYGTQRILFFKPHLKRIPVHLEIGKPLYKEEYQSMKSQEVASIIQSRVQELLSYRARKINRDEMINMMKDKYKEKY